MVAVAITDHDTLAGVPEAISLGNKSGIHIIAGIEISAVYNPGTMHILGYFRIYPEGLEKDLEQVQEARRTRCPRIIKKLNALGLNITMDDVADIAGKGQIGRPHIAKALINKGYVRDFEEAFSKYLAKGKPAYVEKEKMLSEDAITLILKYEGLPVLAHPFTLELESHDLKIIMERLKNLGLMGVEVFYPDHTKAQKKLYTSIARDLDLFVTGGTDYHGPGRGKTRIGDFGVDKEGLHIMLKHFLHSQ
jgi:predicted metal-dependent phosphoesterase TrpH